MLVPCLHSGLGNQLFQLSAGFTIAKMLNRPFGLNPGLFIQSSHTEIQYKDTIYKRIMDIYGTDATPAGVVYQMDGARPLNETLADIRANQDLTVISINGYFQEESSIRGYRNEVAALLWWGDAEKTVRTRFGGDLSHAFFMHYRRGDYVGSSDFWRDLDDYYEEVIRRVKKFDPAAVFYIVSDDIDYFRGSDAPAYLSACDGRIVLVDGLNEIESLWLMKSCRLGGAAPNSTFGWWGLYLNHQRPLLFIPSCYSPVEKYTFPEATVIQTKAT
jgi:hypothetical protein